MTHASFVPYKKTPRRGGFRPAIALILILLTSCAPGPIATGPASTGGSLASPTPFVFPPTFTPTVAGPPTTTSTPRPSQTPISTLTPGPTLAPSATPLVDIVFASDADQPSISRDLLYFSEGEVRIWDRSTGERNPIGDGLSGETFEGFSSAADGAEIALWRMIAPDTAEITLYSRSAGSVIGTLQIPAGGLLDMKISPDGNWLAYIATEYIPRPTDVPTHTPAPTFTPTTVGFIHPTPTATPTFTPTPVFEVPTSGSVFLVRVNSPTNPTLIGECGNHCSGLDWGPLAANFVWGDASGLWEVRPGDAVPAPRQVLEPFLSGVSGSVQTRDSYLPVDWSPSGRFLLVRKGLRQGVIFAVADMVSGRVENLPGTGVYAGPSAGYTWLAGDLFFIARPGVEAQSLLPAGEIWGLDPGAGESIFLPSGSFPFPGDVHTVPSSPQQLPDGRIGFSLVNFRDQNDVETNGIYLLDPVSAVVSKVNVLPFARVEAMEWLPDGSGVVVETASRILFVPPDTARLYSLSAFLGRGSCCFVWVE